MFSARQAFFPPEAGPVVTVTGGTLTTSGAYSIRTFTTSGTLGISGGNLQIEYLVVGGGGGGSGGVSGVYFGGGGGSGVARSASSITLSDGETYTVTVGAGGVAPTTPLSGVPGNPGTSSSLIGTGLSVTATPGQGNPHNTHQGGDNDDFIGGYSEPFFGNGGGAGAAGNGNGLNGGPALVSSITGSNQSYGGGGVGVGSGSGTPGTGGGTTTVPATVNTGSGGGGGSSTTGGTAGASGIVIVRYLTAGTN